MTTNKEHNPDNLTPAQYGAAEGWRLLDVDEVGQQFAHTNSFAGAYWYKNQWWLLNCAGDNKETTYRTQHTRAELRKARGLPEETQPQPKGGDEPCSQQLTQTVISNASPESPIPSGSEAIKWEKITEAHIAQRATLSYWKCNLCGAEQTGDVFKGGIRIPACAHDLEPCVYCGLKEGGHSSPDNLGRKLCPIQPNGIAGQQIKVFTPLRLANAEMTETLEAITNYCASAYGTAGGWHCEHIISIINPTERKV